MGPNAWRTVKRGFKRLTNSENGTQTPDFSRKEGLNTWLTVKVVPNASLLWIALKSGPKHLTCVTSGSNFWSWTLWNVLSAGLLATKSQLYFYIQGYSLLKDISTREVLIFPSTCKLFIKRSFKCSNLQRKESLSFHIYWDLGQTCGPKRLTKASGMTGLTKLIRVPAEARTWARYTNPVRSLCYLGSKLNHFLSMEVT